MPGPGGTQTIRRHPSTDEVYRLRRCFILACCPSSPGQVHRVESPRSVTLRGACQPHVDVSG